MFGGRNKIQVIGTRHGEKLHETLLTREEMARADDSDDYFRVPADTRDLNYQSFFTEGEQRVSRAEDYDSHRARQLDVDQIISLIETLDLVPKRELAVT